MSPPRFEVLRPHGADAGRWRDAIEALPVEQRDVHFLPEYAALHEETYGEPCFLARYVSGEEQALMVLARRSVASLPFYQAMAAGEGAAYADVASPYGFCGPVVQGRGAPREARTFQAFRRAFDDYCREERIVAEFHRLSPMLDNRRHFGEDPALRPKNCTVWMDLRQPEEQIFAAMGKDHRRTARRARERGVEIVFSDLRPENVRAFHALYERTMDRLQAVQAFYLPLHFFEGLASRLGHCVTLNFALWEGQVIAAHMFLHYGTVSHLYLAGSEAEAWRVNPNVASIWEAALEERRRGFQALHLGGGHACDLDGVFHFKSQFSPLRAPYFMYRRVHDPEAYEWLCEMKRRFDAQQRGDDAGDSPRDRWLVDFFPAYRA